MGLREFRDRQGVTWKAWDVTPDSLDRRTMAEDYMREWQDGWLCFESSSARRRLADFPKGWAEATDEELSTLLARAQEVRRRAPGETSGEFRRAPEGGPGGEADRPRPEPPDEPPGEDEAPGHRRRRSDPPDADLPG